jgi:hypothetical protein
VGMKYPSESLMSWKLDLQQVTVLRSDQIMRMLTSSVDEPIGKFVAERVIRRWDLVRGSGSMGLWLWVSCSPAQISASCLPWGKLLCSTSLPCLRPKAMVSVDHGLRSLKLWAKVSLTSFKLLAHRRGHIDWKLQDSPTGLPEPSGNESASPSAESSLPTGESRAVPYKPSTPNSLSQLLFQGTQPETLSLP